MMETISVLTPGQLQDWLSLEMPPRAVEIYGGWCIYHLLTKRKMEMLQAHFVDCDSNNFVAFGCFDSVGNEHLLTRLGITQVPTIIYLEGRDRVSWRGDVDLQVMVEQIDQFRNRRAADV